MKKELTLEEKVQRALDYQEVCNVMARYVYGHYYFDYEMVVSLFSDRDDATAEFGTWGVWKGKASLRRLFVDLLGGVFAGDKKGRLHANCVNTPLVEIAGDGQTAQGMWFMSGAETSPKGEHTEDGLDPHWTWARYAMDFIKEDGVWKIWHLHTVGLFHTPYDTSWVDYPIRGEEMEYPEGLEPDEPTTNNWEYTPDEPVPQYPELPKPYYTFSESFSNYDPTDAQKYDIKTGKCTWFERHGKK